MKHYGIIGKPLKQSFSAQFFNEKFAREGLDAEYSMYPIDDVEQWESEVGRHLDGYNVTIPYKQTIIPLLEQLDDTAREIGAVNVVCHRKGYNTDCLGFIESICPLLGSHDKQALVLGTGGAAKAVVYGLHQLGLTTLNVSRTPKAGYSIGYNELTEDMMRQYTVIVNCTPLGMFPEVDACPDIPYRFITSAHFLYDCIYNPAETLFLRQGRLQGARTMNGHEMLLGQARAAWKIWENFEL